MVNVQLEWRLPLLTDSYFMDILDENVNEQESLVSTSSSITDFFDHSLDNPSSDMEQNKSVFNTTEENSITLFNTITCVFLLGSFYIAMTVSNLRVVLGVVGATGSTTVSYILPGAIYIKLHPEQRLWRHRWKRLAYVQLALGIFIVPVALYFVMFSGDSE